jgi:predicted glutamine amidotransferase
MCIAILNTKKGGRLPKNQIQNSWDNNDMGSGLLWNKDGKLNVFKSYDYDEYLEKYNKLRDDKSIGNIVLHFRIATSGYNGEHNLHPFLVNDDLGFVHNGVIKGLGNKKFSDTYEFNDMLKKYKHNFLNCEVSKFFISEYIGYSKLIFLDNKDKYVIINEELGKWSSGNWYSNDSYKQYNDYKYYGSTKVYNTTKETAEVNGNKFDYNVYDKTKYSLDDYNKIDEWNEPSDIEMLDEWDMFDYLCDIYGLDPNDDASFDSLEHYMALNCVETITQLYNLVTNETF